MSLIRDRRTRDLAMCEGKVSHDSRSMAQKAANRKGGMLAPYRCKACGHWHVGNDTARKLMREFKRAWGLDTK